MAIKAVIWILERSTGASSTKVRTMKLLICTLLATTLVSAVKIEDTATADPPTAPCDPNEECPSRDCADPIYPQGYQCCPSCEHSNCTFRGCVHYGAFFPTWRPDPCTSCWCHGGAEQCSITSCPALNCYGFPEITSENECCRKCDFGIARDECGPVPVGVKSLYVALGDDSCQTDVLIHQCDKEFVFKGGTWYECTAVEKMTSKRMGRSCDKFRRVVHNDVAECVLKELDDIDLPQDDFNPYPRTDCGYYVDF